MPEQVRRAKIAPAITIRDIESNSLEGLSRYDLGFRDVRFVLEKGGELALNKGDL